VEWENRSNTVLAKIRVGGDYATECMIRVLNPEKDSFVCPKQLLLSNGYRASFLGGKADRD
jgi:hypothetical protein